MAASTEKVDDASDSSENSSSLDPRSPCFNPKKVLYAKTITLAYPDAKQFNNLAEFENFLHGKDAATASLTQQEKQKKQPRTKHGIKSSRAAAKAYEAERKAAIMGKSNAGPSERSAAQERKRYQKNVFTRMKDCTRGPLSVLSRCVNERLKVIVVVRAAVAVRSHCRAYVIAFDKHMNMALMDVDETYIRPVVKHKAVDAKCLDRDAKSLDRDAKSLDRDAKSLDRDAKCLDRDDSSDESVSARTESLSLSSDNETSNIKKEKVKNIPSHKTDRATASKKEGVVDDKNVDLRTKLLKSRSRKGAYSDSDTSTRHKDSTCSSGRRRAKQSSMSDSECLNEVQREQSITDKSVHKTGDKFWPLYMEWAERRCYTQYEILERHVNQLFIRGDNVVSVAIAP